MNKLIMSKVRNEPLVFIIDLDNTIIGDISPQITEYFLIKSINNKLRKINKKTISYKTALLEDDLKSYLIRPNFNKFVRNVNKYDNIELFIYTASRKDWANYIIKRIEKVLKFKFNKPIFTRDDLVIVNKHYKKSIEKIKPRIIKSLKNKYYINDIKYLVLIDNLKNVLIEKNLLIKCPSYHYRHQINYLRMIPENIIKKYYIIIEDKLDIKHSSNLYEFFSNYHKLLNKHYNLTKQNQIFLNDRYWFNFSSVLKQNLSNMSFKNLIKILRQIR